MKTEHRFAMMAIAMLVASAMLVCAPASDAEGTDDAKTAAVITDSGEFDSIADALKGAGSQEVIFLNDDLEEDVVIPSGADRIIDLNGHTLTNVKGDTITVGLGATLEIRDSVGGGLVDNISHGKAAVYNNGDVTITSGAFDRSKENGNSKESSGGNSYYVILNHGVMTIDGGDFTLNGKFSSMIVNGYYNYAKTADGQRVAYIEGTNQANPELTINGGSFDGGLNTLKNDDGGVMTINGGKFVNSGQNTLQNHNIATVNGGDFSLNGEIGLYVVYNHGCDAGLDIGLLNINGGTFRGPVMNVVKEGVECKIVVEGGTFDCTFMPETTAIEFHKASFVGTAPQHIRDTAQAAIGSTYYADIADAIADAKKGDTVSILNNITEFCSVAVANDVVIEGGEHSFAGTFALDATDSVKGAYAVDIRNVKFVNAESEAILGASSGTVRGADLTVTGCTFSGYATAIALSNVRTLVLDGCTFDGCDADIDVFGTSDAVIDVKGCAFKADAQLQVAQRGGAGMTDDVSDATGKTSGTIELLKVAATNFEDGCGIVIGAGANDDGSAKTFAGAFDISIASKGVTSVVYGLGDDGLEVILADKAEMVASTVLDERKPLVVGVIALKLKDAGLSGTVPEAITVVMDGTAAIPAGESFDGKIFFDNQLANGVVLADIVAGKDGATFSKGSVEIAGTLGGTRGMLTVVGIAKVLDALNLGGVQLVVPATASLMVEKDGAVTGDGEIVNNGTVKVKGTVETSIHNNAGSKLQVALTGDVDRSLVDGKGEVAYDSIIVSTIPTQNVKVGQKIDLAVITDPADATIVLKANYSPAWLSISSDGHIVGTAAQDGSYNVTIVVSYADRADVTESFIINVSAAEDGSDDNKDAGNNGVLRMVIIAIVALLFIVLVVRFFIG